MNDDPMGTAERAPAPGVTYDLKGGDDGEVFMSRQAWLLVACIFSLAYGGWCFVLSPRVREEANGLPKLTCDELIQNGPGGNPFIKLTDVRLCSKGDVMRIDMDAAMEMYLPIYSARLAKEPEPRDLTLLLEILDSRDRDRLLARPDVGELTCELWTRADKLDRWVCDGLAAKYPGIRVKNCRVLSVGLHEPTEIKAGRIWSYAIVSSVSGGVLLCWLVWRRALAATPTGSPALDQTPCLDAR
jgi:hypothetical protein